MRGSPRCRGVAFEPSRSARRLRSPSRSAAAQRQRSTIAIDEDTVVVDVRTPAEYAGGHLDGAVNIDLQSGQFEAAISELDPEDAYVVYCRSGNRSAQAAAAMEAAGLDVHDAGGISEAAQATGLAVVQ